MTWVVFLAGGVALGLAWFVSKTMQTRIIVAVAALVGVAGYSIVGNPAMPDQPLSERMVDLETLAQTSAESLTGNQLMALLQKRAQDNPDDPVPHKFMGDMMMAAGRPNEAILAYQSALRRDPEYHDALKALADTAFKMTADVDPQTTELYRRAFKQDPSDLRLGYLAALGDWRAGRQEQALEAFAALETAPPEGDPRRQMFSALREMLAPDSLDTVAEDADGAEPN